MRQGRANEEPLPQPAAAVLDFWFGELDPKQHFARDDEVDAAIAERFGELHASLSEVVPQDWLDNPRGVLAAVIVLDQFSRNLFRQDARAYAQDPAALRLARMAVDAEWDEQLPKDQRQFLYMPFMHSERLEDVARCTELMEAAGHDDFAGFARKHAEVIARFGRYPARNAALGRETTPEEAAFLAANPSGF